MEGDFARNYARTWVRKVKLRRSGKKIALHQCSGLGPVNMVFEILANLDILGVYDALDNHKT